MTAAAAVPSGWGVPRFDNFAFEGRKSHAVSAQTGIAFSDFMRCHVSRRSVKQIRRLPDPDFASDLSKLKRLVLAFCENSLYIAGRSHHRFDESRPAAERIEEINRCAAARLPAHRDALDRLLDRHHKARLNGMPQAQLRSLEIQITNLDSRIRILPRLVAVVTAVLYRFYFLGWDSVQTCNGMPGVKPLRVRQACRRARIVWERLNGGQVYALPNGEFAQMAPTLKQRKKLGIDSCKFPETDPRRLPKKCRILKLA